MTANGLIGAIESEISRHKEIGNGKIKTIKEQMRIMCSYIQTNRLDGNRAYNT